MRNVEKTIHKRVIRMIKCRNEKCVINGKVRDNMGSESYFLKTISLFSDIKNILKLFFVFFNKTYFYFS